MNNNFSPNPEFIKENGEPYQFIWGPAETVKEELFIANEKKRLEHAGISCTVKDFQGKNYLYRSAVGFKEGVRKTIRVPKPRPIALKPLEKNRREREVFELMGKGLSVREIAETLGISPKTIETYKDSLRYKLGCKSGFEVVVQAIREPLLKEIESLKSKKTQKQLEAA